MSDAVEIPVPTSYDAIQVTCTVLIMRNDKVQLDPYFGNDAVTSWTASGQSAETAPSWVLAGMPRKTSFIRWSAAVTDNNYLTQLLHKPRMVTIWYLLPPAHSPPQQQQQYFPKLIGNISDAADVSNGPSSKQVQSELNRYSLFGYIGSYDTATIAQLGISP